MDPWLSKSIFMGECEVETIIPEMILEFHMDSYAAEKKKTYLTSQEDAATTLHFLDFREKYPP